MAQFEFVAWLVKWILEQESFDFDWDQGNSTKSLQKHKISSASAEQAIVNRDLLVPLGIQVAPVTNEPRFGALGTDFSDKKISLCFTISEGRIRIISARPMSKIERKNYESIR
ncbi:MAG: BrnT family toxin [Pseudobdellovibrionaceae bacterium]